MRKFILFTATVVSLTVTSCRAGKGCPTNGRNVGAERLLSGDAKTLKAVRKAGKFNH